MKKYEAIDLLDYTDTVTEITCTSCQTTDSSSSDEYDAIEHWFEEGWRATETRSYCPDCAKKRLKQKTWKKRKS